MPRKTKEITNEEKIEKKETKAITKKASKTTTKKTAVSKAAALSKTIKAKKAASKTKKNSSTKGSASKNVNSKAKVVAKKASTSRTRKKAAKVKAVPIVEYYDLPYRYNQTIVKLLAQTPKNLFVYWDISDEDRENYKRIYGENFFEETKPILIIHNKTLNYSFEVEINDFANSWYIHVNDSKCDYSVELGRRPIPSVSHIETNYIYVSSSNDIESPNDKILFNTDEHKVYFRNVKTNVTSTRSISFIKNMGKIYNIYDLYKTIYEDETLEDLPTSSTFK
ncbi:MAG: DUF4912 domain-containing protein [Clostridia bacterium]|nr:DUF4912 domain-containing protein [Clostridia bacterium]